MKVFFWYILILASGTLQAQYNWVQVEVCSGVIVCFPGESIKKEIGQGQTTYEYLNADSTFKIIALIDNMAEKMGVDETIIKDAFSSQDVWEQAKEQLLSILGSSGILHNEKFIYIHGSKVLHLTVENTDMNGKTNKNSVFYFVKGVYECSLIITSIEGRAEEKDLQYFIDSLKIR